MQGPETFALGPVHPRTRKALETRGLAAEFADAPGLTLVEPVSYLEFNGLLRSAAALLTYSGGMQKEAYFLGVPCVTLREETEWVETVAAGWKRLAGTDPARIAEVVAEVCSGTPPAEEIAWVEG